MNLSEIGQVKVSDIMQGNTKTVLHHANKRYLLSITRRGKLILTAAEKTKGKQQKTIKIATS